MRDMIKTICFYNYCEPVKLIILRNNKQQNKNSKLRILKF